MTPGGAVLGGEGCSGGRNTGLGMGRWRLGLLGGELPAAQLLCSTAERCLSVRSGCTRPSSTAEPAAGGC